MHVLVRRLAPLCMVGGVTACTVEVIDGPWPSSTELAQRWHGVVQGDDVCQGGELVVFLDEEPDVGFSGTAYYESEPLMGERYRATFRIEARQQDGQLRITEKEAEHLDDTPIGWQWCFGDYTLSLDESGPSAVLGGEFHSTGCGCRGTATLAVAEPW